jgi:Ca2+-transporting ATPase
MSIHGRDAVVAARLGASRRRRADAHAARTASEIPKGLDSAEARRRLARDGPNELPQAARRNLLRILVDVMREPMLLLLASAAVLYVLLGNIGEASILCASVVAVIALTIYQEGKSERALRALRDLASPRAAVMRDGALVRIAARDVVVGDIIMAAEGDRVPADARVIAAHDLSVDESILTGESMPVTKRAALEDEAASTAGTVETSMLYSTTLVVAGHAFGEVSAVGARTEVGRIGRTLGAIVPEKSPLQREIARVVIVFAALGVALCALVSVLYLVQRGGWIDALLAGITLAIANIPEEFPVILSVFLAMGAWRLARHHVLTRRPAAIETLGAVTVLCSDKTGTLTENRMAVRALGSRGHRWAADDAGAAEVPETFGELIRFATLASEISPFDPMEKAIVALAREAQPETLDAVRNWRLVREYPLSTELLAHTHVWKALDGHSFVVACKGAPEAIATLCGLDADVRSALLADVAVLARDALRVIAVAAAEAPVGEHAEAGLPVTPAGFSFRLLGLVGLADPLRDGVRAAVEEAAAAGVRTIMLTGDYPATAAAIAGDAGLDGRTAPMTGEEIEALDDAGLRAAVGTRHVFARVRPEQKLRLVEALKANGDVVAMTGDGVNDAIALKAAHVGIAMGARGADVAREAAALVLLDDNFVSIVHAVRLGRVICDNIVRALRFVLAVHVPVAGIALLPLLLGSPLVLWPIHIVVLELIIDPACSIVFEQEPAESNVMRRPPRDARAHLLDAGTIASSLLIGLAALAAVAAVYVGAWMAGRPAGEIGALTFAAIVTGNLGLIALNRTGGLWSSRKRRSNRALRWVAGFAVAALAASLYVPHLRALFRFDAPPLAGLIVAVAAPIVVIVAIDRAVRAPADRRRARRNRASETHG